MEEIRLKKLQPILNGGSLSRVCPSWNPWYHSSSRFTGNHFCASLLVLKLQICDWVYKMIRSWYYKHTANTKIYSKEADKAIVCWQEKKSSNKKSKSVLAFICPQAIVRLSPSVVIYNCWIIKAELWAQKHFNLNIFLWKINPLCVHQMLLQTQLLPCLSSSDNSTVL